MAIPKTLRNFGVFVDGRGYLGKSEEVELPKLTIKTEDFRGGGMDAALKMDMGQEPMEASITMLEWNRDLARLWGLANAGGTAITLRGAQKDQGGEAEPIVVNLRGQVTEIDGGTWKAGDKATKKLSVAVDYYKLTIDGEDVIEIDIQNMIRKVGGTDQLAAIRQAIGG